MPFPGSIFEDASMRVAGRYRWGCWLMDGERLLAGCPRHFGGVNPAD
jgi:hypothetical protein